MERLKKVLGHAQDAWSACNMFPATETGCTELTVVLIGLQYGSRMGDSMCRENTVTGLSRNTLTIDANVEKSEMWMCPIQQR